MLTGSAIGAAAKAGYLIPAAVPFALVLILILRFMNPKLERIAWAAFTVWLGSTYVQLGSMSIGAPNSCEDNATRN